MPRLAFALALLLAPAPALAFELSGATLPDSAFPFAWWTETADGLEDLSTVEQQAAVQAAYAAWAAAVPCADLSASWQGSVDRGESYDLYDGDSVASWGDPQDVLDDSALFSRLDTTALGSLDHDDETVEIFPILESDLSFDDGTTWLPASEAADCDDEELAEVVALRLVGFQLGLAQSCEEDQIGGVQCTDDEEAAVMFNRADTCDPALTTPGVDDVRGLLALYTPIGTMAGGDTAVVAAGVEACLARTALRGADQPVTWDLGDGTVQDGVDACHTWAEPGEYTVQVSTGGCVNDAWGEVLACQAPAVPAGSDHAFEVTVDGGSVQVRVLDTTNDDRCVLDVAWEISQTGVVVDTGSGVLDQFVLPDGVWTVGVTITGVAGELTDSVEVTVGSGTGDDTGGGTDTGDEAGKDGCGCAGAGGPAGLLLALPGLLLARRRRA